MGNKESSHDLGSEFSRPEHEHNARKIFRKFDKDNSGFLDREEYKAFLDEYWKFAAEQGRFLGVHLDKAGIMAELNKGFSKEMIIFGVFWA
eukprot:g6622.t1